MASVLRAHESEIALKNLVTRKGLAAEWPQFEANHWKTATAFAYACGINYNDVEEDTFHKKVVLVLLNMTDVDYNGPPHNGRHAHLSGIRQIFGECQRMLHAAMAQVGSTGDQKAQPIHDSERSHRRITYQRKLEGNGLLFEDELCHAHCIEDDANLMRQREQLSYLHPKNCPTRDQEIQVEQLSGGKSQRPEVTALTDKGAYTFKFPEEERPDCTVASLLTLQDVFRRRGGGFEVGGLMDNHVHEQIVNFLMKHLRRVPYRDDLVPPTIQDALECDKEIFTRLSKLCSRDMAGLDSLPVHVPKVLEQNEIVTMVACRIGTATRKRPAAEHENWTPAAKHTPGPKAKPTGQPGPNADKNREKRKRQADNRRGMAEELIKYRAADPNAPPPPPKGGKKGKGKAKGAKGKGKGAKGGKGDQWW